MTSGFEPTIDRLHPERGPLPDPYGQQAPITDGPEVLSPVSGTGTPAPHDSSASTTSVARQEAGELAGTAADAGKDVAQTVKDQAGQVTAEAGRQAREMLDQVRSEVTDQAASQQQRVAAGLRSVADELSTMADRSDQDGPATDLARQAADRVHAVAQWLDNRDPGSVLDEVRGFARRRPVAYLAIAAGAGVLAGRLTRGLAQPEAPSSDSAGASSGPARSGPRPTPNGQATAVAPPLERYSTGPDAADAPFIPNPSPASGAAAPTFPTPSTTAGGQRGDLAP